MKVTRDAFLFLTGGPRDFAQCGSCSSFTPDKQCAPLGIPVRAKWSCGLYTPGRYDGQRPAKRVSAEQAGLVKRQVRCENCRYFDDDVCRLFEMLNRKMPKDFDLDVKVYKHDCCNANSTDRSAEALAKEYIK